MASDFGIKISNPTFDANKAADYQLLFNSSWPSIAIAFEDTVEVPYKNNPTFTIAHNLGFYPLTQCWLSVNGQMIYMFYTVAGNFTGGGSYSNTGFSVSESLVYPRWQWNLDSLSTAYPLGFDPFGNYMDGSLTASVHVKCYNLDISQYANYTAPKPATVKYPYDPNFGLKVAKKGKSTNSHDLRDFILHTRAQSPAVLAVLTQDQGVADPNLPGNTLISYTNTADYVAWFFGFQKANFGTPSNPDIRYTSIPVQPANYTSAGASVSGTNVFEVSVPSDPGGSLVVLRDPLFAPSNIFVSY